MRKRAGALRVSAGEPSSSAEGRRRRPLPPPPLWLLLLPTVLLVVLLAAVTEARPQQGAPEDTSPSPVVSTTTGKAEEKKKYGDDCADSQECGVEGGTCDSEKHVCTCLPGLSVTNHIDKCGKKAVVNESCFFHDQCESENVQTECRDGRCACRFDRMPFTNSDGTIECVAIKEQKTSIQTVDPAMIGVLVGLALMFIILCVVLRLFSKARWRENRTIFNTPNPRLMNVSLLRDSKLLHGAGERRASRGSIRAPSRQPSMASLRPQSPAASLAGGGSRRGSKTSNGSATSPKSPNSPTSSPPPANKGHGGGATSGAHGHGATGSGNTTAEVRDPNV
ncbi:uncharacterized protein LOC124160558 isoform X2 [Ischnura elegans]|uniref:uncharacterized protein LOC124160558 isoform X2 n=1 Tax=Ischnura elegans TaxID=197161 RepID=UPI001ED8AF07|nr:uncharacterized protein LOC124160558 isoform X2 [Ischnura elegans]